MTSDRTDPSRETLELGGSVWFQAGAQTLGGASRIALLAAIGETGSITSAAKAVGISYKGAWDAVDTMNNLAGEPLVVRLTGGKGGGGTTLTPRAVKLIETFRAVEREHQRFLERAGAAIEGFATDWDLIGRIGVKTSARNQLYGTVVAITRGTVNDEITLTLPGGHVIVSVITHESTEALGLAEGVAAFALIKASWVVLLVDDASGAPLKLSARNQLRGTVQSVKRGAVNAEVSLVLEGGAVITAVVTNGSVDTLGLVEGGSAVAAFKASSVILGVKD
ncbi:ModE family transcriptional regulator [Paraburkholderia sp. BL18I3N2]|uniref:TOBE domain-containing protein n=1 Tax=Paraburkholderia sp. BL18I3N2 TaxID=1938799 RepID=UPI000D050A4F|nr:TOBE domain-containing protein [Paraburkholderia sp. BL18I3N2]PRX27898.1 ModE family transcriptional regulator [Paraburkholderia sp. BL18I3N2]